MSGSTRQACQGADAPVDPRRHCRAQLGSDARSGIDQVPGMTTTAGSASQDRTAVAATAVMAPMRAVLGGMVSSVVVRGAAGP